MISQVNYPNIVLFYVSELLLSRCFAYLAKGIYQLDSPIFGQAPMLLMLKEKRQHIYWISTGRNLLWFIKISIPMLSVRSVGDGDLKITSILMLC